MKLILTAPIEKLGVPGDVVEVKDGYGRNYLLPRGLAIVATRGAEKQVEGIRRSQEAKRVRGLDHANELKQALEGLATAGALAGFDLDRRQALWLAGGVAGAHPGVLPGTGTVSQAPALPTMDAFETTLASLEGDASTTALAFASGMGAISAALSLLPHGGRVIAPRHFYNGTSALLDTWHEAGRAHLTRVDLADG